MSALAAGLGASSAPLPLTEYRGAQTVRAFSDADKELAALLTQTGVYDLGWRGFFRVSGKDRVRWLNGMVTNSVTGLEENAGCYAFVLNAQGRIQGDLDLYRRGQDPDALWIRIDRAQAEALTAHFRRYIIMDKVAVEPQEQWTALGVGGPRASDILARLGFLSVELTPIHLAETSWQGHTAIVVATHSPLVPRYEIWIESKAVLDLWHALTEAGAIVCGVEAIEHLRILEGTPAYGTDIVDRDLPQETGQMRALNFNKGCYLGQEIVERIRSRGSVHRTIGGFLLEGEPPPAGTPILAEEKPVGDLTSIARVKIPGLRKRTVALGHIRREVLLSSTVLTADREVVQPSSVPFDFGPIAPS